MENKMLLLSHWCRKHHVKQSAAREILRDHIQLYNGYEFVPEEITPSDLGYMRTYKEKGYLSLEGYYRKWSITGAKLLKAYISGKIAPENIHFHKSPKLSRVYVKDLPPEELFSADGTSKTTAER